MQGLITLTVTVHTEHEECVYTETRDGVPRYWSVHYWVSVWDTDLPHTSVKRQ
jgi:hypothetical protein